MNYQIDYNTIVNVVCIPFIIALTAIAFPLLLQSISRIDEKYSSINLVKVFYKSSVFKYYKRSLILPIIAIVIWCWDQPRLWDFGKCNKYIDISAFLLIGLSLFWSLYCIYHLYKLIKYFYIFDSLVDYLKKEYRKVDRKKRKCLFSIPEAYHIFYLNIAKIISWNLVYLIRKKNRTAKIKNRTAKRLYFLSIADLFYFSIRNSDNIRSEEIVKFFEEIFRTVRANNENKVIIYPNEYYNTIFYANDQFFIKKEKRFLGNYGKPLIIIFFEEGQKTIISEETYEYIWLYLRQYLYYERTDFIMYYWQYAHRHFQLFMQEIKPVRNDNYEISNQDKIEKRKVERERFLEFHYALGGLLMHSRKMELLKEIMTYTTQNPSKYFLVPDSMKNVIKKFINIGTSSCNRLEFQRKYQFPGNLGIFSREIIHKWIRKYFALLFLRQYTLSSLYYGKSALELPAVPETISELNQWKIDLDILDIYVKELLSDNELLQRVGFGYLNDKWFDEKNKKKPADLIKTLIERVNMQYDKIIKEQYVSEGIKEEFNKQIKNIASKIILTYKVIDNEKEITDNFQSFHIDEEHLPMKKAQLEEDITHLCKFFSFIVSSNIHNEITSTFSNFIAKEYLMDKENIFAAIDKLQLNRNEYCILSFGVDLLFFSKLGVPNLEKENDSYYFHGNKIIILDIEANDAVRNSIIVLKKDDLPKLVFDEIDKKELEKYKLEKLDKEIHLYASVFDLNDETVLHEEISKENKTNLVDCSLLCFSLGLEIRWKNTARCYQFKIFNQFRNNGLSQKLEEIKPIKEKDTE